MDILNSYLERRSDTHQDFDEVASQVPAAALGGAALAIALGQIAQRVKT